VRRLYSSFLLGLAFRSAVCVAQSGSLDFSFRPNIVAPSGDRTFVTAVALQADGKIVVGGRFETVDGRYRYRLARLNTDGSLDLSFAFVDPSDRVNAIGIHPDHRILIGGAFTTINGVMQRGIARLNANGSLDTGFNHGGTDNSVGALAIATDEKIYVGGSFSAINAEPRYSVARLWPDGGVDWTFHRPAMPEAYGLAILPLENGKSIIGGKFTDYFQPDQSAYFSIMRLNSDGSIDPGFYRFATKLWVTALAMQPDGKIVTGEDGLRLNPDGTLDETFQNEPGPYGSVNAVAIQPDGKVIMGGTFTAYNGVAANRIVRLNTNGTVDLTFAASADSNLNAIALQPDGRVLIGGEFQVVDGVPRTLIARLLGDFPVLHSSKSDGNELTLWWPAAYTNYVLESVSTVPSVNWQPVSTSAVVVSNDWTVTTSIGSSNSFFRLMKP
jgi:uncharacterized delta-60 repeat protein